MYMFVLTLSFLTATAVAQIGEISSPSVKVRDLSSGRIRGFMSIDNFNTDFYLGGLMRVHTDTRGVQCSETFVERGVEETEAFLFAIDSVNNDPNILPNITIGYDVRDYCGSENIAIDEASEWVWTTGTETQDDQGMMQRRALSWEYRKGLQFWLDRPDTFIRI